MIRKKYCILKTGKKEEDITLKHFKPIETLKQIIENIANDEFQPIKKEVNVRMYRIKILRKENLKMMKMIMMMMTSE